MAEHYRAALGLDAGQRVGEAWVFSLDPAFPSLVDGTPLADAVESTLLLKLLDAAEPLSVQIHPADDYAGLTAGQSGKPEAWYVLARDPGAGLFLGFKPGVTEARVARALAESEDVSALMHFVQVEPGDFFVIDAGTPHAIGAGVMLVEPQRVLPGWSGVTYRYWDWNRRYDAHGRADPSGEARELHVAHALAVTDWARVTRPGFVDEIRVRTEVARAWDPPVQQLLTSPTLEEPSSDRRGRVAVPSKDLSVMRLAGSGSCELPDWSSQGAAALCVLEGVVELDGLIATAGQTLALVAHGQTVELTLAHAILAAARP